VGRAAEGDGGEGRGRRGEGRTRRGHVQDETRSGWPAHTGPRPHGASSERKRTTTVRHNGVQRPPFKKTATRPRAPRHDHAGAARGGQGATAHGRKRLPSAARRGAPRGDARASRGEEARRTAMMAHMREGTWSDTVTTRQLRGSLWNRQAQTHSERQKLKARSRKHSGLENLQTIFTPRKSQQAVMTSRVGLVSTSNFGRREGVTR